jgi:hypothetical protein
MPRRAFSTDAFSPQASGKPVRQGIRTACDDGSVRQGVRSVCDEGAHRLKKKN